MRDLLVAFRHDLVLGDPGAAPRAPRHHVVPLVHEAALPAPLEEHPDAVVVLVGHRVVRVVPVHPVAEAQRLLRLDARVVEDAGLAPLDELGDPVPLDVALAPEPELLLDLDLHPQPLAVEAVLVALAVAQHRVVAAEEVLVRPPPGMVDAHRVVGGDGPVEERPAGRGAGVTGDVLLEDSLAAPPLHQRPLLGGKIDLRVHRLKRHPHPPCAGRRGRPRGAAAANERPPPTKGRGNRGTTLLPEPHPALRPGGTHAGSRRNAAGRSPRYRRDPAEPRGSCPLGPRLRR